MRSVTLRLDDLRTTILNLGYVGENEHTRFIFDCKRMFDQYPSASASLTVAPPAGESYPAVIERDGDLVKWVITDSDLIHDGCGEIQLSFTESETVAKTFIARTKVSRSLVPAGEIPEGIDDFLTRAGAVLTSIPETINDALADAKASGEFDGPPGEPGQDGYSPTATVSKSGKTATITITDKNGTTTAQISDGEGGGTSDYSELENKPKIAGVTISGNVSLHDIGAAAESAIPDPTSIIDDTAGDGATNKTWSADKLSDVKSEISQKQDAPSATGTAGQVLGLNNDLEPEWVDQTGGGSVDPSAIAAAVDDWCDENITNPSNPPLDRSCLSSSSAAPADILGAVKEMGTTQKTGLISPFVQGSISGGTVDPTATTSCYIGPFDVKKDDTVTYSRYNSDIAYSNSIILFTTDGTYSSAVALMPGDTYTFLSDGKFAAQCTVNTGRTLENAITAANNSFTVSLSEEPKIVTEVKKTDGKIATAVTESENAIYPHMIGIKNYSEITDVAKAVIRSVVLYDADPTATYCLVVMDAALNSTAKFEIYKMTSQMGYDTKVCEYNSSSFDGSKIIRLAQANSSGIHAEICLDWSEETSINIYGVKYVIDPSAYRIDRVVQEQNILLPSNLYVLNNRPQQIFPKSLLINRTKDGNNFTTEWYGYSESDKLGEDVVNIRYSANGADMDVSLRLQDQLTGETTYFASKKFHVNPIATATNESLKVLCIGDSFMDYPWYTTDQMGHSGKGIMAFIKEYASADSNTIDFIGTHLSYTDNGDDYYSEAYGGWSEDSYVDNAKHSYEGSQIYSPFCINGTANSYSAYFTALGETPDIVVFFLGMNGDYSSTTGQAIQTMITGIKAVNASTKFIVCTIPGYFKNRYLYNYSYSSGDNQKYMKNNAYYTLFDGEESSGVYICPINAMWSSEYHYITANEAILRFNTDVKMPICRNHHPNQTGVQMIADAIYTVIQAIMNAS